MVDILKKQTEHGPLPNCTSHPFGDRGVGSGMGVTRRINRVSRARIRSRCETIIPICETSLIANIIFPQVTALEKFLIPHKVQ